MALTVTHAFVSAIADDAAAVAAGEVVPSNWNASHIITGEAITSISVTPSSTISITIPAFGNAIAIWTAGQDETINLSGGISGQILYLEITADASFRTITLGTGFKHISGSTGLTFAIKALKTVFLEFVSDGTNFWEVDGRQCRGVITAFSGSIANIPDDFVFCNGSNGTPDIRNRMIAGAQQDTTGVAQTNITGSLLTTGGAATHSHSVSGTITLPSDVEVDVTYDPTQACPAGGDVVAFSGSTNAVSNVSPFYALAFMMKL